MKDLKPCPFCGGKAQFSVIESTSEGCFKVRRKKMIKHKRKFDWYVVGKGGICRFFRNACLAYLFMRIASCGAIWCYRGKLERSCEDRNTRYITSSCGKWREVYRKAKRGWYHAGRYRI